MKQPLQLAHHRPRQRRPLRRAARACRSPRCSTFAKSIGGSPTNVAVAAARLGRRSAVVTAVGDDELGRYVRRALERFGVDTRFVGSAPDAADAARDRGHGPARRPDASSSIASRRRRTRRSSSRHATCDVGARVPSLLGQRGSPRRASRTRTTARALLDDARPPAATPCSTSTTARSFWTAEARRATTIGAAVDHATVAVGNRAECESPSARPTPSRGRRPPRPRRRARDRQAGRRGRARRHRRRARARAAVRRWRSSAVSARATRSAVRSVTRCSRGGRPSKPCGSPMPPVRSSPRGSSAPTRCRPSTRSRRTARGRRVPGTDAASSRRRRRARTATPSSSRPSAPAGTYCGLRVVDARAAGESRVLATGIEELAVLPLAGSASTSRSTAAALRARRAGVVFARVSDWAYVPIGRRAAPLLERRLRSSRSPRRGRERRLRTRARAAEDVPSRSAAPPPATRQVTNFLAPDAFDGADRADLLRGAHARRQLVVLPAAQARRHAGQPGLKRGDLLLPRRPHRHDGLRATRASASTARTRHDGSIDATVIVRDGDVFLVPRGYHGPCVAAPGYPLYYLNVMAGPSPRADDGDRRRPAARTGSATRGRMDAYRPALPDDLGRRDNRMRERVGIGLVGFGWMGQAHSAPSGGIPMLFPDRFADPELVVCSDTVDRACEERGRLVRLPRGKRRLAHGRGAPGRRPGRRHRAEHAPRRDRRGRLPGRASMSSARSRSAGHPPRRCEPQTLPARPA